MMGRKTMLAFANMAAGVVLGLAAGKLVAYYLGTDPLGELTAAMGFLGLLFFITDLGMGQAHVKRVSEGRDPGDCFATFAVFKAVSTLSFIVLAAGGMWLYLVILGKPLESTTLPILVAVLIYFVAKSLQDIGQSSFDARLETARAQLATFMETLVRVVLTILFALTFAALAFGDGPLAGLVPDAGWTRWIREEPGLALAIATMAGGLAAGGVALALLRRSLERGRFRAELLRDYATFAIPLFLTSAIGVISQSIDAAVLGFFLSESETGVFGGIRRIVGVLTGMAIPVGLLLFPTMSGLVARGDRVGIERTMDRSLRYLSMLIWPMATFVAVFAAPLIRIFLSAAFETGALPLAVFCLYVVLVTLAAPHANLVLGMGRSDIAAKLGAATAIVIIVLNLVLVPDDIRSLGIPLAGLGVLGTAIATTASGAVYYGLARFYTWRLLGYRERAHVWRHALAAALMAGGMWAVHMAVHPFARWFDALLFVPLGAAMYGVALLALRELSWDDWRYLRESVHPGEMLRYLRDELRGRRPGR